MKFYDVAVSLQVCTCALYICRRLNRAHPKISEGAGNLIFWLHVGLRVVSKASKMEASSLFSLAVTVEGTNPPGPQP